MTMLLPPAPYDATPSGIMLFLERECGMRILQHLMQEQAPDRERMLESAPISRNQLSQLYGVSRAHINRLLADAEARGLLSFPTPRRVVFSPELSEDYERTMAAVIQRYHAAYLATLATEPPA
jgi:DNA-binding transcriptional regulator LsrR (DeoR family)